MFDVLQVEVQDDDGPDPDYHERDGAETFMTGVDDGEHDGGQAHPTGDDARQVEPAAGGCADHRHQPGGQDEREGHHGNVDPERRTARVAGSNSAAPMPCTARAANVTV